MNKILENFLKEINKGRLYKAQKFVAEKTGVSDVTVSKWCSGKMLPSDDNIAKMAKIFKKSEDEIRNIFLSSGDNSSENKENNFSGNFVDKRDFELLKEKVKNLELEMELIKTKSKK